MLRNAMVRIRQRAGTVAQWNRVGTRSTPHQPALVRHEFMLQMRHVHLGIAIIHFGPTAARHGHPSKRFKPADMDKYFEYFHDDQGFGPGIARIDATERALKNYQGVLPERMLEYWRTYGWRGWGQGLFWTVDPEPWRDVVDLWLRGTPFEHGDRYHLIGRGAFGKLLLWGENNGPSLSIDAPHATFYSSNLAGAIAKRGMEDQASFFFASQSTDRFDMLGDDEAFLFARAAAKLGPLDHETMYGFVPALAFGGEPRLDHLQKLDAIVHLTLLAQMAEPRHVSLS